MTKPALTDDVLALLYAKAAAVPENSWMGKDVVCFGWPARDINPDMTELMVRVTDGGYGIIQETVGDDLVFVKPTPAGEALMRRPVLTQILPDLSASPTGRAWAALWGWLLKNGSEHGSYGSEYTWGRNGEIAHLFTCGLDKTKSTPVRDDVWTEWGGTFGTDTHEAGVAGTATCRCGAVAQFRVQAQVSSITDLIAQIVAA